MSPHAQLMVILGFFNDAAFLSWRGLPIITALSRAAVVSGAMMSLRFLTFFPGLGEPSLDANVVEYVHTPELPDGWQVA